MDKPFENLTRRELAKAIAYGQGRAVYFLRAHGGDAYLDVLTKAFSRHPAWDQQSVPCGDYHWRLAQTLSDPSVLVPVLERAAKTYPYAKYFFRNRLSTFAENGSSEARDALYRLLKQTRDADFRESAADYLGMDCWDARR